MKLHKERSFFEILNEFQIKIRFDLNKKDETKIEILNIRERCSNNQI